MRATAQSAAQPAHGPRSRRGGLALRVVAAIAGGYLCTQALVAAAAQLLALGGLPRSEAVLLATMPGFLLYLVLLLWCFSAASLRRICGVLLLGSALEPALRHALAAAGAG